MHRRRAGDRRDRSLRPLSHPLRPALERQPGDRARLHDRRGIEEEARRSGEAPGGGSCVLSGARKAAPPRLPEDKLARFTDAYFLKTKAIVGSHGDKRATYAVFMRRPVIATPRLMVEFVEQAARDRGPQFDIELNPAEGAGGGGEPMGYLSGSLYHLGDLETPYLQKLGAPCVAAYNAYAMCADLPKTAFLAMDARHCAGAEMAEMMAYAASVGSAAAKKAVGAVGFIGNATDATAHYFGQDKGLGTMPHALVGYAGSTLRAAAVLHSTMPTPQ